jgi:hypothetical protein
MISKGTEEVTGEIYEPPMAANVISGLKLFLILSQP